MERGRKIASLATGLSVAICAGLLCVSARGAAFCADAERAGGRSLHEQTKRYSADYGEEGYEGCEIYSAQEDAAPSITVLTHGLAGNASAWSNDGASFAYCGDSVIAKIGQSLQEEYDLCLARWEAGELVLQKLDPEHYADAQVLADGLTDVSRHIVVLYESGCPNGSNAQVYEEFDRTLDLLSLQYKAIAGELPFYNLIGHSRGGLTNLEYAIHHPYNVAALVSIGTPYCGASISCIDAIMEMLNYRKDENGKWNNAGVDSILDAEESLRLRDGWNAMRTACPDAPLRATAIGAAVTFGFVGEFVRELADYSYVSAPDFVFEETARQIARLEKDAALAKQAITRLNGLASVLNWCGCDLYAGITFGNVTYAEAQTLLGLMKPSGNGLLVADDLFVDLDSQLGNGVKFSDGTGYEGMDRAVKIFTAEEYSGSRSSPKQPAVAHNLECMNGEITDLAVRVLRFAKGSN